MKQLSVLMLLVLGLCFSQPCFSQGFRGGESRVLFEKAVLELARGNCRNAADDALKALNSMPADTFPEKDSLQCHAVLAAYLGMQGSGDKQGADKILEQARAHCNRDAWPYLIISHMAGEITEDQLLSQARQLKDAYNYIPDLYFYLGIRALESNDIPGATNWLLQARRSLQNERDWKNAWVCLQKVDPQRFPAPPFEPPATLPAKLRECEYGEMRICGDWTGGDAARQYKAKWDNTVEAKIKVESFSGDQISLKRKDTEADFFGTYQGKWNRAFGMYEGEVNWKYHGQTWSGKWMAFPE